MKSFFRHPFFIKLFHWEYWSFHTLYACIYPVWILFSLRARSFFFFAAANPRIPYGGFTGESKKDIYDAGPVDLFPQSVFFDIPCSVDQVIPVLKQASLDFPLVAKPDIGARGQGVMILKNRKDLEVFLGRVSLSFHIQEYIPYPKEVGIFFCKIPGKAKGRVTGIVRKEFLKIYGDGIHTMDELLQKNQRACVYLDSMRAMHRTRLADVLPAGQEFIVSPYGNHARGALFLDDSYLIDGELEQFMNEICSRIPLFHYGRLDIRFDNWDDLKKGRHFRIIEVNGAGAEPTHMYDPRHTIFFAWKEIIRHWYLLLIISLKNHRKGYPYLTYREGLAMLREEKEWRRKMQAMQD
jgi:hypothetical protein